MRFERALVVSIWDIYQSILFILEIKRNNRNNTTVYATNYVWGRKWLRHCGA